MFRRLVVATDLSPASDRVVDCVAGWGAIGLQRVTLAHVHAVRTVGGLVAGASIKIETDGNSLVSSDVVGTGSDGSAVISLTATNGPSVSLNLIATAEGYTEGKETLTINVDSPDKTAAAVDLQLPEWIVYVIIAAILLVGVLIFIFFKKSKKPVEEEWEEEEI